jgi:hypothetical protein
MSTNEVPARRKSQRAKAIRLDYSALDDDGSIVPSKRLKEESDLADLTSEVSFNLLWLVYHGSLVKGKSSVRLTSLF